MEGRTPPPGPHEEGVLNIMQVTTLVPLPCHLPTSVYIKALADRTVKCPSGISSVASHSLPAPIWTAVFSPIHLFLGLVLPLPSTVLQSCTLMLWPPCLVLLWFDLILQLASILQSHCLVLSPQQLSKRAGSSCLIPCSGCLYTNSLPASTFLNSLNHDAFFNPLVPILYKIVTKWLQREF